MDTDASGAQASDVWRMRQTEGSKSLAAENAALKAKLAKMEKKLETTHKLLGLQKKIADILGVDLQEKTEQE